jgi:hypothetical protein
VRAATLLDQMNGILWKPIHETKTNQLCQRKWYWN